MKFAKELERDLVPEWRLKYLDYKVGKKKLKAINRALRNVNNQTPRPRRRGNTYTPSPLDTAPRYSFLNRSQGGRDTSDLRAVAISNSQASVHSKPNGSRTSLAREAGRTPEEQPLNGGQKDPFPGLTRYGSIIGSPPNPGRNNMDKARAPPSLKLPSAALDPENVPSTAGPSTSGHKKSKSVQLPSSDDNAFEVGKTRSPHGQSASLPSRYRSVFSPKRVNSSPGSPVTERSRPLLKRVFSLSHKTPPASPADVPLEAYRDLDIRQSEFFSFLDMQLEKIESFYKSKENEATERLHVLREQLHIMRDRRLYEVISLQTSKIKAKEAKKHGTNGGLLHGHIYSSEEEGPKPDPKGHSLNKSWLNPIDSALEAVKAGKYGRSTNAMTDLATPSALKPQKITDDRRDYSRRPDLPDVPYHSAKRKLKVALQEFYRGLELLKSYSLLNRTAFRKINKKYDKTVNARPSMRYMSEKVNKAWFVESDIIEGHIRQVEDLYARYFEKGNHKVAVGKLRIKTARAGDYTENSFRNGVTLAAGLIFGIQGLVLGAELLNSGDAKLTVDTSYLLQIYAGYFLMNFLFLLFCLACRVWHESKINYVFVFEYDTRHHLDWRQLAELPCFFILLLGFFMWFNFNQFGSDAIYIYYPVILLGLSALILFFPAKVLYYRSRMWLIYSVWRLVLAGLYPVEFRDFYLGDMFCSLTYAMGNIELFFCLYAHGWSNPVQCNSNHSRLLGFFAALPAVWRALQCLRRYTDTKSVFPHLLNFGKYMATIIFYVTLSIYRIDKTPTNRVVFIMFAITNSLYCSFWDIVMDWSLGDSGAKHPFLRKMLGYKKTWIYYAAIGIDPILRFNWVIYAIEPLQIQHSAVASFVVALSEVCRRGMWSIFRVENEHCTNVQRFRASRDVPLPYDVPSSPDTSAEDVANVNGKIGKHPRPGDEEAPLPRLKHAPTAPILDTNSLHGQTSATGADLDLARTQSSTRRRRASIGGDADGSSPLTRGLTRVGTYLRSAHAQDFERKRKPELGRGTSDAKNDYGDDSDDSNDESERERPDTSSDDAQDEEDIEEVREDLAHGRGQRDESERREEDV